MIPPGVHWYTGITGSGKTVLAHDVHLRELVTASKSPALITDFSCKNFLDIPHVSTVDAAWVSLYEKRQHTYFRPNGTDDFDSLIHGTIQSAEKGFKIHYLIDEAKTFANNRYLSKELSNLIRNWRHLALSIQLTTQYFGDINSEAYSSCAPHLWIFRSTGDYVEKILARRYRLNSEEIRTLPQWEYRHVYEGFSDNR